MAALSVEERVRYEHGWAEALFLKHMHGAHSLWRSFRYTQRIHAFEDRWLVAWRTDEEGEEPEVLAVYAVKAVEMTLKQGLRVTLSVRSCAEKQDTEDVVVDELPQRLGFLDVFAWVPAFNDVRYTPSEWANPHAPRVLRFALNFRVKSDLHGGPRPAQHYIGTVAMFYKQWPNSEMKF